jgi:hypothetical protein
LNIGFWIDREINPGRMEALQSAITIDAIKAELELDEDEI